MDDLKKKRIAIISSSKPYICSTLPISPRLQSTQSGSGGPGCCVGGTVIGGRVGGVCVGRAVGCGRGGRTSGVGNGRSDSGSSKVSSLLDVSDASGLLAYAEPVSGGAP